MYVNQTGITGNLKYMPELQGNMKSNSTGKKHVNINRYLYKNDGECKQILQGNCE